MCIAACTSRFWRNVEKKIARLRVGNGIDSEVEIGPMIHERQLRIVEDAGAGRGPAMARACWQAARRLSELGPNFYAPTLLADVTQDMRVMQEETFGPVLPVAPFDADEEAVRLANDSDFGLAASVWTRNRRRGEAMAAKIKAGTVMLNDMISCFGIAEAPHGGFKQSGIGRTHGEIGLERDGSGEVRGCRPDSGNSASCGGLATASNMKKGCTASRIRSLPAAWCARLKGALRSSVLLRRKNKI